MPMYARHAVFLVIFFFSAAAQIVSHAQEFDGDAIKRRVIDAWQDRQLRFHSARYTASSVFTRLKDSANLRDGAPLAKDISYETRRKWLIDFDHGRIRRETHNQVFSPKDGKLYPMFELLVFDGVSTKSYYPKDRNSLAALQPGGAFPELVLHGETPNFSVLFQVDDLPVYFAHGIIFEGQDLKHGLRHRVREAAIEVAPAGSMSMAVFARAGLAVWLEGWLRDLWWD